MSDRVVFPDIESPAPPPPHALIEKHMREWDRSLRTWAERTNKAIQLFNALNGVEQIRGPLSGEEWPPTFEHSQRPEWLPDDAVIRLVNDIQDRDGALVLIPRDADKVLDLITRWYNESNPRKRLLDARAERDKAVRALVVCDGTASDQLAALEGERDKAIQERDAAIKRAEHAAIQGSIYERASDNETQRAEAAEAKVADLEAKLHFDEEAGMDNVRRMERAEAKVARVEAQVNRWEFGAGSWAPSAAGCIREALGGHQ
jgi:hypothetical protein